MIDQKFFLMVAHTNFMQVPLQRHPFYFFFDIIPDKAHSIDAAKINFKPPLYANWCKIVE